MIGMKYKKSSTSTNIFSFWQERQCLHDHQFCPYVFYLVREYLDTCMETCNMSIFPKLLLLLQRDWQQLLHPDDFSFTCGDLWPAVAKHVLIICLWWLIKGLRVVSSTDPATWPCHPLQNLPLELPLADVCWCMLRYEGGCSTKWGLSCIQDR